ncbi:MAG: MFS family permease [Candidatus Krumholzibacteriia bacterium]|jgi:MFS family permease
MLFRFSLYGFLKNQRYFEPFLVLFFLDQSLSFTQIGLLVAVRELTANLLEIPSGVWADLYGRRKAMIASFLAYILSFLTFAAGTTFLHFSGAMMLYACGDAFRTGTHKAIIFSWLRAEGRLEEKIQIYGHTRSWSKLGSALSIVIATGVMIFTGQYRWMFYLTIVPYVLGVVNFLGYPALLDQTPSQAQSDSGLSQHLKLTWRRLKKSAPLRRLVLESATFEGTFKAARDYLQPITRQAALGAPLLLGINEKTREPLLIGVVYLVLFGLAAWASRNSYRVAERWGGEEKGVRLVWWGTVVLYAALVPILRSGLMVPAIVIFILLNLMQNLFRPMHVSRFDDHADEEIGATVMSIESQAKGVTAMIMAPALGWAVDAATGPASSGLWPVGAVGAFLALATVISGRGSRS